MALGRILTEMAVVPKSTARALEDLYPEDPPKVARWAWIALGIAITLVVLEYTGVFERHGVDSLIQRVFSTSAVSSQTRLN
jgi:hypothetical protein